MLSVGGSPVGTSRHCSEVPHFPKTVFSTCTFCMGLQNFVTGSCGQSTPAFAATVFSQAILTAVNAIEKYDAAQLVAKAAEKKFI